jgi:hypothetical protein
LTISGTFTERRTRDEDALRRFALYRNVSAAGCAGEMAARCGETAGETCLQCAKARRAQLSACVEGLVERYCKVGIFSAA